MVVHPQDTLLAQLAVVGTWRFNGLAFLAVGSFLQLRDLGGTECRMVYSEPYRLFFRYYRLIFCFCVF